MKSRVHPKYKTKYHVQNWASYERALVRRGNVTVWLSPEAIAAWEPDGGGTRGGQRKYSDVAIETAHLALALSNRLVRDLGAVVRILIRAVDHRRRHRAARRRVTAQLVGDQPARDTASAFQ